MEPYSIFDNYVISVLPVGCARIYRLRKEKSDEESAVWAGALSSW